MSKYFKTLERLRAAPSTTLPAPLQRGDSLEPLKEDHLRTLPEVRLSSTSQGAASGLFDGLRLIPPSAFGRSIVIAGASSNQAARSVLRGIEVQAERASADLVIGELQLLNGSSHLRLHRAVAGTRFQANADPSTDDILPVDLDAKGLSQVLRARIETVNSQTDTAILLGPPLAASVDAALLARATTGLVLVVEPLKTKRSDLFLALNRAESSGCSVLGIVSVGTHGQLPQWIQRLVEGATR